MKKNISLSLVLSMLVATLCVPATAVESDSLKASTYISSYTANVYANGGGEIAVDFDIIATRVMDELGAIRIVIEERSSGGTWRTAYTAYAANHPTMLTTNRQGYLSSYAYEGTPGLYYRATVWVYAANAAGSDIRSVQSGIVKCK